MCKAIFASNSYFIDFASVLMSDVQAIFLLKILYSDNFIREIEKKTKDKSIPILID